MTKRQTTKREACRISKKAVFLPYSDTKRVASHLPYLLVCLEVEFVTEFIDRSKEGTEGNQENPKTRQEERVQLTGQKSF